MADTILLDRAAWDLVLTINDDIAMASEPYSLAQDAASAIKTFVGEVYWDTTVGVPYLEDVLAKTPSPALLKARLQDAALTVPDVGSAQVFLTSLDGRVVEGQVQVTSKASGLVSAAPFSVLNPQGAG